jgi:hypothetical protein
LYNLYLKISYHTENAVRLHYKDEVVNAAKGSDGCVNENRT